MEEPLLGSRRRSSSSFTPALSQIPEEPRTSNPQISPILVPSPSIIKERLIFGSPDTLSPQAQFAWFDYTVPPQQSSNETKERHLLGDSEEVCTCGSLSKEAGESFRQSDNKSFDDSFVDNRIMGSSSTRESFLADLTRLDLDVRALSPRYVPSSAWSSGLSRGFSKGELDKDSDKASSHSIPISLESPSSTPSTECRTCTKKQFHRSRTAPAMTVMEDKAKPHAKQALSTSRSDITPGAVVTHAFLGLILYLAVGVAIYTWKEDEFSGSTTHNFVDAIYFCIVTLCTIGYGDITPTTPFAKLFSCAFVLVGFGFIDILLSSMVNYVLDSQEALLLTAVTTGHHEKTKNYLVDIKKGRMRIRMKVALAFGVVIACIGVGTFVMHFLETLGWLDSFYLACMSVTTVGYGDHAFTTLAGRLFASMWLLVSTLAVARSFLYLAEARIDRRHRLIAKLVLQKEMTLGDLVAADLDNDGCISKSDFVVYKLKLMRKIEEKDIAEVCRQFDRLDTENSGKITLSCLINLHEASEASK
ncbi:hypothetical protein GOP47_0020348 [Adiantum capillus-veneris]|uniref:Potassium channel domain-containing protein n=1 Tax=Adiantum capillus-veneris TaxID=13818 RepID=A0A9D4UCT2_ADICA|nr:hypothetical protein GOP47_0020348 [Adiantum capillus-veneris]